MTTLALLLIGVTAVVVAVVVFGVFPMVHAYFKYRGKRLITCPETLHPEAVRVAAGKAAAGAFVGEPNLRLDQCSRWPERHDCGQECRAQIEADPEKCLVWNIVSKWYEDQSCVYCHRRFGPLHHLDHVPALMGPDRKTIEWDRLQPQQLPEIFSTYKPVCWNCHITETFRQEHPELVVNRQR
jgi:hypothetical protein